MEVVCVTLAGIMARQELVYKILHQTVTPKKIVEYVSSYNKTINFGDLYDANTKSKYLGPIRNILGQSLTFDRSNHRTDYVAQLLQLQTSSVTNEHMIPKRLLRLGASVTTDNILNNRLKNNNLTEARYKDSTISYAPSPVMQRVQVLSPSYEIDASGTKYSISKTSVTTEDVPVPFLCIGGCGGEYNGANVYEGGECIWSDTTKCNYKEGWFEPKCEPDCAVFLETKCNLTNGVCLRPGVCQCNPGYVYDNTTGLDCNKLEEVAVVEVKSVPIVLIIAVVGSIVVVAVVIGVVLCVRKEMRKRKIAAEEQLDKEKNTQEAALRKKQIEAERKQIKREKLQERKQQRKLELQKLAQEAKNTDAAAEKENDDSLS